MLSLFRQGGIAQVLLGGVVFTIILVFVLEFRAGGSISSSSLSRGCIAEVHGFCISQKEYSAAYGLVSVPGLERKEARRLELDQRVLDGLIERELLLREAEKFELSVGDEVVEEELLRGHAQVSLPASHAPQLSYYLLLCRHEPSGRGCEAGGPNGVRKLSISPPGSETFDTKWYERDLRMRTNRGPREFKDMQRRELTAELMRDLVRSWVRVSEKEALELFQRERTRATIRYAMLDRAWFERFAVNASEADVSAWAQSHAKEISEVLTAEKPNLTAGCPWVSEIRVDFPLGATDADKLLSRDRIDAANARLKKKDSFVDVARDLSDAPSAAWGGKAGCLGAHYGVGHEALSKAVEGLSPGQATEVIETERAFHILKLESKPSETELEPLAKNLIATRLMHAGRAAALIDEFIKEAEARAKASEPLSQVVESLAKKFARIPEGKGNTASAALDAANRPKVEISAPFTIREQPLSQALPSEALAHKVFQLSRPDELLSTAVLTQSGKALVQLKEKDEAKESQFANEKGELMADMRRVRAQEALARYLEELRKRNEKEIRIDAGFLKQTEGQPESPAG